MGINGLKKLKYLNRTEIIWSALLITSEQAYAYFLVLHWLDDPLLQLAEVLGRARPPIDLMQSEDLKSTPVSTVQLKWK